MSLDIIAQLCLGIFFNILIGYTILNIWLWITPRTYTCLSNFDWRGVVETVFGSFNAILFFLATIIIAVIGAVKKKELLFDTQNHFPLRGNPVRDMPCLLFGTGNFFRRR